MASAIEILSAELSTDPLARGYSTMTDEEAADSLNTVNRSVFRDTLAGWEIGEQLNLAEYAALAVADRDFLQALMQLDTVPILSGFYRSAILALFNGGSTTRANMIAAFSRDVSRAEELALANGISITEVKPGHVAHARALNG